MSDFDVTKWRSAQTARLGQLYGIMSDLDLLRCVDSFYMLPDDLFTRIYTILGQYASSISYKLSKEVKNDRKD